MTADDWEAADLPLAALGVSPADAALLTRLAEHIDSAREEALPEGS